MSASELVRHFGEWSDRASRSPIQILHHGRPHLIMASTEQIERWCVQRGVSKQQISLTELLDALTEPALVVTPDGQIVAAGRAARTFMTAELNQGAMLRDVLPLPIASYLAQMVERVARTGLREQGELPGAVNKAGRIELTVEPFGDDVVISGRAAGISDDRDAAVNRLNAFATALIAMSGTAIATIGQRGQLLVAESSLASLTGFALRTLDGMRMVSLFSVGSRVAVGDAIEAVFAGAEAHTLQAELLTESKGPLPVRVGLAPLRHGLSVVGVVAALVAGDVSTLA